jgi:hypothetical protein
MPLYFIKYDLHRERSYQPLYDELSGLGAKRVLDSVWCLTHRNATAIGLRDHLMQLIDSNDRLIVSKVVDWASSNALSTPNDLEVRATA